MDNLSLATPRAKAYNPQMAATLCTQTDLPDSHIANLLSVAPSTIGRFRAKLSTQKHDIIKVRDNLLDIILSSIAKNAALQDRVLDGYLEMSEDRFSSLSDKTKTSLIGYTNAAIGTGYDKYRLETGQSTQQIDIIALSAQIDKIDEVMDLIRSRRSGGACSQINRDTPLLEGELSQSNV